MSEAGRVCMRMCENGEGFAGLYVRNERGLSEPKRDCARIGEDEWEWARICEAVIEMSVK